MIHVNGAGFCDRQVPVLSTIGRGPKGPQGEQGEKGDVSFPTFADPIEWDINSSYPQFTIVYHDGNSFTSKTDVPNGIDINDTDYWVETANFNVQLEAYRQEVLRVQSSLDDLSASINSLDDKIDNTLDSRTLVKLESFYAKEIGVYMRKVTIPRSYVLGLVRRSAYSPKPYDYVRGLTTNSVLVNGQLPSVTIINGRITDNNPSSPQHWYYFGWDESGNFKTMEDFDHTVIGATLQAEEFYCAFGIWGPIVKEGHAFDLYSAVPTTVSNPTDRDYIMRREQNSNVFAWDDDNVYLYQCDGRSPSSAGVLFDDLASYLVSDGIMNAVLMDGGGSNQLWTTRPAMNHTMYNYYADSNTVGDVDYNYQGDTSRNVYSLITFTEPDVEG